MCNNIHLNNVFIISLGLLRKIGINRCKKLTPKCKSLYSDAILYQKQLRKERLKCSTFKQRLNSAKIFTKLQYREAKNKQKARRFTLNEKLLSLSLYKQSLKSYRILTKMFVHPSRRTLSSLLSSIPISTGIDRTIFNVIKENVKNLKPKHKYSTIIFYEVSLNASLQYNSNDGTIYGFEDNGMTQTQEFADHSLVFMVRGIVRNFKQPLCYLFCKSTTKRYDLANQICEVVRAVHSTGLKVVSTICDQGSTNMAAINMLIHDTKAFYLRQNKIFDGDFYEVEYKHGEKMELIKIFHLYDTPHLLKGIKNNLLTKNVVFEMNGTKLARWCDIVRLYELDSNIPDVKMLPRLSKQHVIPSEIRKMKVKNAAQVFSQRVASIMEFLASE